MIPSGCSVSVEALLGSLVEKNYLHPDAMDVVVQELNPLNPAIADVGINLNIANITVRGTHYYGPYRVRYVEAAHDLLHLLLNHLLSLTQRPATIKLIHQLVDALRLPVPGHAAPVGEQDTYIRTVMRVSASFLAEKVACSYAGIWHPLIDLSCLDSRRLLEKAERTLTNYNRTQKEAHDA